MFKKLTSGKGKETLKDNRNQEIVDYFNKFDNPCVDRKRSPYYVEMQQLAFNLVRYLRMEKGNWYFTYLTENMSKDDYLYVARKFLGRMTAPEWKDIIKNSSFRDPDIGLIELVEDNVDGYTVYEIKYKPKLQEEKITYVEKPDLNKAIEELERRFELEKLEYKLFS